MVTGIETTGIVLAILPLLLNQVDNYVQGLETLKSFRAKRYLADLGGYLEKLGTQRALFVNTLEQALYGIVDYEYEIGELINDSQGCHWENPFIQDKLKQRMGRNYEPFQREMAELAHLLTHLTEELGLESQLPQEDWDKASVVEREVKKFRHIFKKSVYAQVLKRIKEINYLLRALVQQTDELQYIRDRRESNRALLCQKISREAARGFYNTVIRGKCWACPCKDEHYIRFVLEPLPPKQTAPAGPPGNPRFRMVFSSKEKDSVGGAWSAGHEIEAESESKQHPSTISATNTPVLRESQPQTAKRVRFMLSGSRELPPAASRDSRQTTVLPSNTIQDICSSLSTVTTGNEAKRLLGCFTDSQHRHNMYYVRPTTGGETWQSLENILAICTPLMLPNTACGAGFSRKARLQLAVNLACSVLQFYGNWLKTDWRSCDILLSSGGTAKPYSPYLLHSIKKLQEHTMCNSQNSSILIQNEALFPLGLTLVELSLCQNLDSLYAPEDHSTLKADSCLKTALRLLDIVETESGPEYANVVKRCLLWHGRKQDNLDDDKLQESVFQLIILPLMESLKHFEGRGTLW